MNQNGSRNETDKESGLDEQSTPWLEWLASGFGLALALGAIGYLVWDGITSDGLPPAIQVQAEAIVDRHPGYTVEIRAKNQSGSTAESVVVEGELKRGGHTIETSQATFGFIAGRSEVEGGLYFSEDPRGLELNLLPKGYTRP